MFKLLPDGEALKSDVCVGDPSTVFTSGGGTGFEHTIVELEREAIKWRHRAAYALHEADHQRMRAVAAENVAIDGMPEASSLVRENSRLREELADSQRSCLWLAGQLEELVGPSKGTAWEWLSRAAKEAEHV